MSFLNHNPNGFHRASPGAAPFLESVGSSSTPRPAPFSQPLVPQAGGPADPPALNFQVMRSLRMHRKLALLVGLTVCLALVALGFKQPRTYTASSVIYVEPMVARNLNDQGVPGFDQFRYGSFLDQQMQTIVRPDVLTAALRTLPAGMWRGPLETEQSAVGRLAKALKVERELTSYQITVELKASNPEAAAAIVNAVTNAYLERGREDEFKQADLREQILSEERDRVKLQLETDRKEQAALGASMGLASPADGAANPYDADLTNLRTELATARQARDVAAAQLESVTGEDAEHRSGLNAAAEEAVNTDAGLSAKKAAVSARRVVLESMMAGMTPNNPQYRQAQDEIADLDRALEARTVEVRAQTARRIQDKLRTDLQRTADVESKINAQLAQATAKATGAGPKLQRAAELANDIQRLTARYTTIDEALNALEIETSGPGMAHVPLPASVPLSPDANRRNIFFMAALPLGLLFGVLAAVIARMRDRRIYLASDLQEAIGFAPIAVLPSRADVSDRVTEEYVLRLAAGVESAYRTAGAQSFVVTAVSAATDTGTLLGDLSRKLEELRLRVLVLAVSELLVTSQETEEHQAATAGLLTPGTVARTVQAGEGIASAKLDRLKAQHDILLIDAAPVLHSAETEYAARCVDATILVAESGLTQMPELAAATDLLSRLRVTGVGAVLDQVKLEQADQPFRNAVRIVEQRSCEVAGRHKAAVSPKPLAVKVASANESPVVPVDEAAQDTCSPLTATADIPPQSAPNAIVPASAPPSSPPRPVSPASASPSALAAAVDDQHTASDAKETSAPADLPHRPFSDWTAQPELLPEKSHQEIARHEQRFELLGDLAGAASTAVAASKTKGTLPNTAFAAPTRTASPAQPERPRAALHAASAKMQFQSGTATRFDEESSLEPETSDDPHAVGRFVGQQDTIGAVPSYTRSRIRLAFKEQEVNSKTTWFSKLFRGDPPSKFRIVPEGTGDEPDTAESQKLQWEEPPVRLPEAVAGDDLELSHLLQRIKTSGETKIAPRPQTIAADPNPPAPAAPPLPFVERRAAPRPMEIDEYFAPVAPAPLPEASAPEPPPVSTPPLPPSVPSALAPATVSSAPDPAPSTPPVAPAPPVPQPEVRASASRPVGRPLRPLTFHQLAGSIEAEALHGQPGEAFATAPPAFAVPAPEPRQPTAPIASVPRAPLGQHAEASAQHPEALPPAGNARDLLADTIEAAPPAPNTPMATAVGHTGVPLWPAKQSMVSSFAAPFREAEAPPLPEPLASHSEPGIMEREGNQVVRGADVAQSGPSPAQQPRPELPNAPAPPPSARRVNSERIPVIPDPMTDPAPAPRPYRLETPAAASERPQAAQPETKAEATPASTVPGGTSFPPDHEARVQMFGRRKTDRPGGGSEVPGLTRRWKLLSQFEPVVTDPLPAHRKGYTRSTDFNPPRRNDEG